VCACGSADVAPAVSPGTDDAAPADAGSADRSPASDGTTVDALPPFDAPATDGGDPTPLRDLRFFFQEKNQGKGAAIRTAIPHVNTDLAVIHDADLEYHPSDLPKMIPLFLEEYADAVFGSRFLSSDFRRVLFFRHSLGNKLITLLTNLVTDHEAIIGFLREDIEKMARLIKQYNLKPE
jgi:glycosyltransferase involved in cell wall biosynthesis